MVQAVILKDLKSPDILRTTFSECPRKGELIMTNDKIYKIRGVIWDTTQLNVDVLILIEKDGKN